MAVPDNHIQFLVFPDLATPTLMAGNYHSLLLSKVLRHSFDGAILFAPILVARLLVTRFLVARLLVAKFFVERFLIFWGLGSFHS